METILKHVSDILWRIVSMQKQLRTPFLQTTSGQLLLVIFFCNIQEIKVTSCSNIKFQFWIASQRATQIPTPKYRISRLEVSLGKGLLTTCSKLTGTPMPKCDYNKVAKQLYWNHTSALVFSCNFSVYFQNTIS